MNLIYILLIFTFSSYQVPNSNSLIRVHSDHFFEIIRAQLLVNFICQMIQITPNILL